MSTLSIAEFKALIERDDWLCEQQHDVVERLERPMDVCRGNAMSLERITVPHAVGWASLTSRLKGVSITYTEGFNYDEFQPGTLSTSTGDQDEPWSVEGVDIVGDDGKALSTKELTGMLPAAFHSIDYRVLGIDQILHVDVNDSSQRDTLTLHLDYAPDIRFTGTKVGSAVSTNDSASASGHEGTWMELTLYWSLKGKYICHQVERKRGGSDLRHASGKVCDKLDEVQAFFGQTWLAKELYRDAGIDRILDAA